MAIKLKRGLEVTIPTLQEGEPGFTTDSKKLFVGSDAGNIEIGALIEVTWQELKDKRDAGLLTPGQQYRITDYECTTVEENTQSAGHPFDIIVTADDVDKLNENARACHHDFSGPVTELKVGHTYIFDRDNFALDNIDITPNENDILIIKVSSANDSTNEYYNPLLDNYVGFKGADIYIAGLLYFSNDEDQLNETLTEETEINQFTVIELITYTQGNLLSIYPYLTDITGNYFANSKLEAWKLKYCLDNDTLRFAWADEVNGKGVIYRMIDEFNNDCPYDFKNIQFKRKLTDGEFDPGTYDEETWVYTFTMSDLIAGKVVDISLKQNTEYANDDGDYTQCANNVIKEAILDYQSDGLIRIQLNDNVFLTIFDNIESYLYFDCNSNTFGNNCRSNTFGNSCSSNNFGDGCSSNTFGNSCYSNTFSDRCNDNTFGNRCSSSTFGESCQGNTFGDYCNDNNFSDSFRYNTFGNSCQGNTFGYSCQDNTFGNDCNYNAFGGSCGYNTFGNSCQGNTFGYSCYSNTFSDRCNDNTFGNRCSSSTFGNYCNSSTFGNACSYLQISDTSSTEKKYIHVDNGLKGASSANKFDLYDAAILDKNYQVTFKKSASGKYLMLWATDTGTMTGKVKNDNIDNTWEDIV